MKKSIHYYIIKYKLIKIACMYLFISCNPDESTPINKANSQSTIEKEITLKELGYDSYENMLADGWKVIYKAKQNEVPVTTINKKITAKGYEDEIKKNDTQIEKPAVTYPATYPKVSLISWVVEKLDEDQIKSLEYSDNKLMNLYSSVYNATPEGVAINNFGTYYAYTPLLTNTYNWCAFVETGNPSITKIKEDETKEKYYTVTLTNASDKDEILYNSFNANTQIITYWNTDETADIKIYETTEFSIPIPNEEMRTTIELGFGGATTNGTNTIYKNNLQNELYYAIVPARSKTQILIKENIIYTNLSYELPVYIFGTVGLNFSSKVKGHYFWGADASLLLKNKKNKQKGSITIIKTLKTEIITGKPKPLLEIN